MPNRRDIRRLAMQILYQIDLRGEADMESIFASLAEGPDKPPVSGPATQLAQAAWHGRGDADEQVTALAPDWPTYRQPPVDRAILRLAYHEIVTGRVPTKVAINEAVELAKRFGTRESSSFINGVLDRLAKRLQPQAPLDTPLAHNDDLLPKQTQQPS